MSEEKKELSIDDLDKVSGGANGVERPCPVCGQEQQWTKVAMDFMCFNKNCSEYFYGPNYEGKYRG